MSYDTLFGNGPATGNVTVTFTDHSGILPTIIGSDVINLGGLSQDYQPDSTSAIITWNTDSDDIGAHVIEIGASTILGEDPLDNTVWATVLVEPRDYATYVRGDPWDMTEGGNNACDMQIGWRDAIGQWHTYTGLLGGTGYCVGNGWDRWSIIGPIDLDSIPDLYWGNGGYASELWLLFKRSGTSILPPEPVDIRIGWVRLEESAP